MFPKASADCKTGSWIYSNLRLFESCSPCASDFTVKLPVSGYPAVQPLVRHDGDVVQRGANAEAAEEEVREGAAGAPGDGASRAASADHER